MMLDAELPTERETIALLDVHQSAVVIQANLRLHAEVPLVAFLGLMHLRVAFAVRILCGNERCDDGGFNNAAPLKQPDFAGPQRINLLEYFFSKMDFTLF
jgi:hypothetical protein